MVRDILDIAIRQHKSLTITYSKDGASVKVFYLDSVVYSSEYGNNYICGYCKACESLLTFRIDKIIHADIEWIELFGKDTLAYEDGLFLLTCMDDMHLEYELRKYKKGERLQDYYQNEDGIPSCHSSIDLLAYHFIPFYTEGSQRGWIPFEKNKEDIKSGFYTFAYILTNNEPVKNEEEDDCAFWMDTKEFPSPYELANSKANGIYYSFDFLHLPFDKLRMPTNIKVLAYNYCSYYSEEDHGNHWRLAEELGI